MNRLLRCARSPRVTAFLVVIAIATGACRTPQVAYPGPRRARDEVARLEVERGRVIRVDGAEMFAPAAEILPGVHDIVATFSIRGEDLAPGVGDDIAARLDCRCRARLLPGGRYRIRLLPNQPVARHGADVVHQIHAIALLDDENGRRLLADSDCGWRRAPARNVR